MTTPETKPNEELSPEVGGTILVNDPHGVSTVEIEGAKYPIETTKIPGVHFNGNEPLEY